jgi:hypothetical protein
VGEETAILRDGWRDRLILVTGETRAPFAAGVSKCTTWRSRNTPAGREKDLDFTAALVRHAMISREELDRRLSATPLDPKLRTLIARRIDADFQR